MFLFTFIKWNLRKFAVHSSISCGRFALSIHLKASAFHFCASSQGRWVPIIAWSFNSLKPMFLLAKSPHSLIFFLLYIFGRSPQNTFRRWKLIAAQPSAIHPDVPNLPSSTLAHGKEYSSGLDGFYTSHISKDWGGTPRPSIPNQPCIATGLVWLSTRSTQITHGHRNKCTSHSPKCT